MNGMVSVVVTLCHLVTVAPDAKPFTGCVEKTIHHAQMNVNACGTLQAKIADWFGNSEYADDYWIGAFRCVEGDYRANGDAK